MEKTLRIGMDARPLREAPCGIRRYFVSLFESLLRADDTAKYLLFTNGPVDLYPGKASGRVELRVVTFFLIIMIAKSLLKGLLPC